MLTISQLSTAFLLYDLLLVALIATLLWRLLSGGSRLLSLGLLMMWVVYTGAFSWFGLMRDPTLRPPGPALLVGPVVTTILLVTLLPSGRKLAAALPISVLIGMQLFRIGPELTIAVLHELGLAPKLLTLQGGNFEILIALSAPIFAWIATRSAIGWRIALVWNVIGLASLANVAVRSVLTAPGPLNVVHTEVPNLAFGNFPFGLIPGFMAPLALALHVLALRAPRPSRVPAQQVVYVHSNAKIYS
jgi:hypothetical protein